MSASTTSRRTNNKSSGRKRQSSRRGAKQGSRAAKRSAQIAIRSAEEIVQFRLEQEQRRQQRILDAVTRSEIEVTVSQERFEFEVPFWSSVFKEHCIMLNSVLVSSLPILKAAPLAFEDPVLLVPEHEQLPPEKVEELKVASTHAERLKKQSVELIRDWAEFEQALVEQRAENSTVSDLSLLWQRTLAFKGEIHDLVESERKWIGYVYITLVKDMIEELLYFRGLLEETVTPAEEIQHWIQDSAGHMALAAHLADPGLMPAQRQMVRKHLDLGEEGNQIVEARVLLTLQEAINYTERVQAQNLEDKQLDDEKLLNTSAPPLVLVHVIKEAVHGLERLKQLGVEIEMTPEFAQLLL